MSFWENWSDGKKWAMGIASAIIVTAIVAFVRTQFANNGPEQLALEVRGWIDANGQRTPVDKSWNNFNITIPTTGRPSDFVLTAIQTVNGVVCAENSITPGELNFPAGTMMDSTTEYVEAFRGGCQVAVSGDVIQCFFDPKNPELCP